MQAVMYQEGDALDYTPGSAISGGDVVVQNDLVGVSPTDVAANGLGSVNIEDAYLAAKDASVFAVGDPVYWDDTNNQASSDPSVGKYMGFTVKAAATGDTTVAVKLDQSSNFSRDLHYSQVAASTAVTTTTVATKFDKSDTIAANALKPGDVIRVRAQAIASSTNSTDTLTLKLFIGSLQIVATAAVDVANSDIGYIDCDVTIRTIGALGTVVAAGVQALGTPGTVTAKPFNLASSALDTTAANVVAVEATWSTNNAGNSARLDVLNVQVIRK